MARQSRLSTNSSNGYLSESAASGDSVINWKTQRALNKKDKSRRANLLTIAGVGSVTAAGLLATVITKAVVNAKYLKPISVESVSMLKQISDVEESESEIRSALNNCGHLVMPPVPDFLKEDKDVGKIGGSWRRFPRDKLGNPVNPNADISKVFTRKRFELLKRFESWRPDTVVEPLCVQLVNPPTHQKAGQAVYKFPADEEGKTQDIIDHKKLSSRLEAQGRNPNHASWGEEGIKLDPSLLEPQKKMGVFQMVSTATKYLGVRTLAGVVGKLATEKIKHGGGGDTTEAIVIKHLMNDKNGETMRNLVKPVVSLIAENILRQFNGSAAAIEEFTEEAVESVLNVFKSQNRTHALSKLAADLVQLTIKHACDHEEETPKSALLWAMFNGYVGQEIGVTVEDLHLIVNFTTAPYWLEHGPRVDYDEYTKREALKKGAAVVPDDEMKENLKHYKKSASVYKYDKTKFKAEHVFRVKINLRELPSLLLRILETQDRVDTIPQIFQEISPKLFPGFSSIQYLHKETFHRIFGLARDTVMAALVTGLNQGHLDELHQFITSEEMGKEFVEAHRLVYNDIAHTEYPEDEYGDASHSKELLDFVKREADKVYYDRSTGKSGEHKKWQLWDLEEWQKPI